MTDSLLTSSNPNSCLKRFLLLYGSQTGQAKAIAEEVSDQAEQHGLFADLHCLSTTDKKFTLEKEACVIFVVSTTGDGEPPETAMKFWRRLKKTTNPATLLSGVSYSLLGLGDSNYTNFCNFGKTLDKRLLQLGASHLMDTAHADDAVGLELVVEPWINSLWSTLRSHLHIESCIEDRLIMGTKTDENTQLSTESIVLPHLPLTNANVDEIDGHSVHDNLLHVLSSDVVDGNEISGKNLVVGQDLALTTSKSHSAFPVASELVSDDSAPISESEPVVNGDVTRASLGTSIPPLSECKLTIPPLPPTFLEATYSSEATANLTLQTVQNGSSFPSCVSSVTQVPIISALKLTTEDAVKTVLELTLDISETKFSFLPGDAFGIVVQNCDAEVDDLIKRLNLTAVADVCMEIHVSSKSTRKNASVPSHLPPISTLRHVLTTCCDIRSVPKKAFLRTLAECTTDLVEKRRLQELCSRQGADDYNQFVRSCTVSLLKFLMAFPSCNPPVERILEHLTRLQARPYSVACSPLVDPATVKIVFTVVKMLAEDGNVREGVSTGWLNKITCPMQRQYFNKSPHLEDTFSDLTLADPVKISIFQRTRTKFCLPEDPSIPMILIGPGTGLAPFIGFLQHREMQRHLLPEADFGSILLFFGCRQKGKDYIYRDYLEHCVDTGVLSKLFVTFSRESSESYCYVQHAIVHHAEEIVNMIVAKHAMVCVCGDAKNMSNEVQQAVVKSFVCVQGISQEEGTDLVKKMQSDGLYLQDVWA